MKNQDLSSIREIEINLIELPVQIDRDEIDPEYIKELGESIRELGLLQPIIVSKRDGKFTLVAGHRRLLATERIGRLTIMASVKELSEQEEILARAVENLQRVDLTVIEEARVYLQMVEKLGMNYNEIGKRLGKGPGLVRRKTELLKLPECLIKAIHSRKIGYAVAEELASLNEVGRIEYYLGYCIDHGATLAVVRQWVQDEKTAMRLQAGVTGGGRYEGEIPKEQPVYVPCDLCAGPMTIGSEYVYRACPACNKQLKEIMVKMDNQ